VVVHEWLETGRLTVGCRQLVDEWQQADGGRL